MVAAALRNDAGLSSVGPSPEQSATAAGHGEQRLRLGFSLDLVVREYGDALLRFTLEGAAGAPSTFVYYYAIVYGTQRERASELVAAATSALAN